MDKRKSKRNTLLFIGFFLLAGVANLLSRSGDPAFDALMAAVNYMTFIGLLLFWIQSVRTRLLPSGARSCMVSAAWLMLLYLLVRIFKYRFAVEVPVLRYSVYLYYVPMALIPALFLMTSLCARPDGSARGPGILLPLVPAAALALAAVTNDLHQLFYRPKGTLSQFIVNTGTYSTGPLFWLMYAWIVGAILLGLVLFFLETRQRMARGIAALGIVTLLWLSMVLLSILVFEKYNLLRMYNVPEVHIFGMLSVFEICVRNGLIPSNQNYAGYFRTLRMPAVITDPHFRPVYRSETPLTAETADLRAALREPVFLPSSRMLSGNAVQAGFIFWEEDVSEVQRAQDRLAEANEMIEEENSLIRAETEQKEKDAYLESRHRIYHEIAAEMYPCQQRIGQLLDQMTPGAPDFREKIARVSVLNAYVKRKTNLLLLAAENAELSTRELCLALEESANYLTLAGLRTTVWKTAERTCSANWLLSLYDTFEILAEQMLDRTDSLVVSFNDRGLRLVTETAFTPNPDTLPLPVQILRTEEILYMDIFPEKGGNAA